MPQGDKTEMVKFLCKNDHKGQIYDGTYLEEYYIITWNVSWFHEKLHDLANFGGYATILYVQ